MNPLGLICKRVLLASGLWARLMGVAGMVRRARVRWVMGLSVLVSVLFVVSGTGKMSTLGYELGGVCMTCTLGACAGEGGR